MKRFLTLAVLFLLLIGTMPVAHAQEIIPEVSTLSELQDAIAQAEEGDTIKITQTITINFPVTLGIDGKPVTLCGADGLETLLRFEGDWGYASYCWLYDLTIDGTGSFDGSKVVVSALAGAGVFCGQSDSSFKADSIIDLWTALNGADTLCRAEGGLYWELQCVRPLGGSRCPYSRFLWLD